MPEREETGTGPKEVREVREGSVLDVVSEMISLHDNEFNILRANRALAEAFSVDSADLIGRKCYEVFHGTSEPPVFCPHLKAMATNKAITEDIYEPNLGKYLLVSITPINDGNSAGVVKTFHVARDITKPKETERSLKEARDHLEELVRTRTEALDMANKRLKAEIEERKKVETELRRRDEILTEAQAIAHMGSFEWNMRTNELVASRETQTILGLPQPEVSFENLLKMIVPNHRENVLDAIRAAIDSPTGQVEVEYAIIRLNDKQRRVILSRGRVTKDRRSGQPLYMRGVLWDITAQRHAQAELRAAGEVLLEGQNELRRLAAKLILKEQGGIEAPCH